MPTTLTAPSAWFATRGSMPSEASPRAGEAITEDGILGGRLRLRQPAAGYRVGIDPLLLAAAAPALGRGQALELGAGVGAASLALAWRQAEARVLGLELQPSLAALAIENAQINGLAGRVAFRAGDLMRPPPDIAAGGFDLVLANPPFHVAGSATAPAEPGRALGHVEGEADLVAWIAQACALVRPGGQILLIHRPERLTHLLGLLEGRAGGVTLFPFWAAAGKPARRVLVLARKGSRAPLALAAGMVLHEADGRYTAAAEAVLRHGEAIDL
jgi:tRNA1(Val) A37 N6-methylase TrmN6